MKVTSKGYAVIEDDTHHTKWVEETGRLDHNISLNTELSKFIKPSDTVIDIGAHIGTQAAYFAQVASKVICFEPNPIAFECLHYNMNGMKNVELYQIALSDAERHVQITYPQGKNYGAAYITPGMDDTLAGGMLSRTLDSFSITPDFIKIDAEGSEFNILLGGRETIRKYMPVVLVEINRPALIRAGSSFDQVYNLLRSFGYICRNVYEGEAMEGEQFDMICLP